MRTSRPLTATLEKQALNGLMRAKIKAALESEAPDVPAADVFKRMRARNACRSEAEMRFRGEPFGD